MVPISGANQSQQDKLFFWTGTNWLFDIFLRQEHKIYVYTWWVLFEFALWSRWEYQHTLHAFFISFFWTYKFISQAVKKIISGCFSPAGWPLKETAPISPTLQRWRKLRQATKWYAPMHSSGAVPFLFSCRVTQRCFARIFFPIVSWPCGSCFCSISVSVQSQKALELKPNDAVYYYNLGNLEFGQDNLTEALRWFDKAIALGQAVFLSEKNLNLTPKSSARCWVTGTRSFFQVPKVLGFLIFPPFTKRTFYEGNSRFFPPFFFWQHLFRPQIW